MNLLNKEWGRNNNFSRTTNLMNTTGFDQATNSYKYNVNTGVAAEPINGTMAIANRSTILFNYCFIKELGQILPKFF
jgi:hypothetical protein